MSIPRFRLFLVALTLSTVSTADLLAQELPGFSVAGSVSLVADLDGDGSSEIYGNFFAGFRALNAQGQFIDNWIQPVGGGVRVAAGRVVPGDELQLVTMTDSLIRVIGANGSTLPNWPISTKTSGSPDRPVLGDVDGDGLDEIVYTHTVFDGTFVYAINGTAQLLPGFPLFFPGSDEATLAVGDLDFDAKAEVVVGIKVMLGGSNYSTTLYVVDEGGTIRPGWPIEMMSRVDHLWIADLDNDLSCEILSFATLGSVGAPVRNADGSIHLFGIGLSANPYPALVDLDADRVFEIVRASSLSLSLITTAGFGEFLVMSDPGEYTDVESFVVGDVNNDGISDVIASLVTGANSVIVALSGADFTMLMPPIAGPPIVGPATRLSLVDINNDNNVDLVYQRGGFVHAYSFENPDTTRKQRVDFSMPRGGPKGNGYAHERWYFPPFLIRGDANSDGIVELSDAVLIFKVVAQTGSVECFATIDVNSDRRLTLEDPVYLLTHLFLAGAAPGSPYPQCQFFEAPGCVDTYCP